jgi:N12 class adenine-specific DNA methylase
MAVGATGPDAVTALDVQAHAAATSPFNATPQPTEAQKQAGNYAKGHVKFQGMDIAIENPAGSVRSGTDADGKAWENTLAHHYGYIKGTVGRDKDHLDVFIKPGAQTARMAYVIDQADPKTGAFDEHKIVLGADSEADAHAIYHANYQEGWQGFGAMTAMPMDEFKAWVKSGKTKKPLAYVEPKEVRTASRTPKAANSLLQAIVNRGGISREIMQDVGGDPSGRYMPGLFTKTGTTDLSALAGYLFDEDGFHQIHQDSPIGPARELEDLITRALGGEKILSTTAMEKGAQAEENAKLKEKAQRLGVKTVARKIEDIAADVLRIEAQNVLDEETALEDEALVAYNETVDALRAAYGDNDAEHFLEDLASKYQDETHLNYLRSATIDIQEKINAQAVQSAEKSDEAAARPAGQGHGTGGAQGGDRTSGEEARPALALSSQSEAELAARDKAARDAEAQRLKDEQAAENKRQADAERGSFQLTGSDRPADVLAAQGQGGLFDAPAPSAEVGSPQEEYESVIDDLSDAEVEALFKKANLAGAKASIDQKRAMLRAEKEADIFPLYEAMMDANEVPGGTSDRFDSEGAWDIEVANFPEPAKTVNANASAGPVISPEAAAGRLIEWKKEARRIGKEEDHGNEVIFSLFDATGEISKPWREAGYTVLQYDIKLGDDLLEFFPMADILEVKESGMKVVGVIAQPPCTCFSSSGARWWSERHDKTDRDMVDKMFGYRASRYFSEPKEYTKALVSLVDLLIGEAEPAFFVMENPVGRIATEMGLPKPTLIFDPHVYGNPYTKKTQLWGKFNTDLPTANVEPTQGSLMHKLWSRAEKDGGTRSITPEGFAYAFFMANHKQQAGAVVAQDQQRDKVAAKDSRANVVIRDVRSSNGAKLGDLIEPYDGTKEGAIKAAKRIEERFDGYQDASNIQSRIGATDENGRPKWAISPNLQHISPVDTAEGRATFGDEDAIREVYGKKAINQPAEPVRNSQTANERQKDVKGNPIYKMGERVEYVDGQYKGRHGAISQVMPMTTTVLGLARDSGYYAQNQTTTYYYHVKTDNGADFMASPEEIRPEESKQESVVPDINVDGYHQQPESVLRAIGYAKQSAEGSRAAAQRARKASSIADHKRQAATQDEKAARYQAAWDAWAAKYPAEAEKVAPKPAAKPAAPAAGGSAPAPSGDVLKAAGLKVTKGTTNNGKLVWEVSGNTKEHMGIIKAMGGRWYGPKKVWSFYNDDPTATLTLKLGGQVTIAGTPTIQMPDKSLEQIAASSQPAAEKARAELEARDQADEVDLGALFDEVLAEETAPKATAKNTTKKSKADPLAEVREFYKPGNIIHVDYWNQYDKVIEFKEGELPGQWGVKVQQVKKEGDQWVPKDDRMEPARWHATAPGKDKVVDHVPPPRTATQAAASAAVNTGKGLLDAIDGLGKLFGSNGSRLSSGLTFDEETYAKAKPLFASAVAHFKDAGADLKEAMRAVVRLVLDKFGPQITENMRPYIVRFMEDVKAGNVVYDGSEEAGNNGNDQGRPQAAGPGSAGERDSGGSAAPHGRPEGRAEAGDGAGDRGAGAGRAGGGQPLDALAQEDAGAGSRGQADRGDQGRGGAVAPGEGARGSEPLAGRDRDPADVRDQLGGATTGAVAPKKAPSTEGVSVSGKADFQITEGDNIGEGGQKTKARNNIAAIRLLKKLDSEDRKATPAEQKVLAKYVGWGGIKQIFDEAKADWTKERQEFKALVTDKEYAAARRSMLDAHYTSTDVVSGMWSAAAHLGFKGGRVLEPSVGVGNFFGMMPADMRAHSQLYGVELDRITAQLAKNLYPSATIANMGFQDVELPTGSFDLAIGNPPFGDQSLFDKHHPELRGFPIHSFFFAKTLDKLRPGGVLQLVVSRYLMDSRDATGFSAREYLAARAKLLGAIRLPYNAFLGNANTEVVTDIIFLQKLADGEAAERNWSSVKDIETTHPKTGEKFSFPINEYFVAHPEMVIGTHAPTGKMRQANQYNVEPREGESLYEGLGKAIANLPRDVMTPAAKPLADIVTAASEVPEGTKVLGYYMAGNVVMQRQPDAMDKRQGKPVEFPDAKAPKRAEAMIGIRNALRDLMRAERSDATDKVLATKRERLGRLYDDFKKKYGYINQSANRRAFRDDPDLPLLESLEPGFTEAKNEWTGEMRTVKHTNGTTSQAKVTRQIAPVTAGKADIFSKRVLPAHKEVTTAASANDALIVSLNAKGEVDPEYMEELYGKPWDAIRAELGALVFHDPNGGWETADAYLSGNVKAKLKLAEAAADRDPQYLANVEALRTVIPADVPALKISVRLGSPWIPSDVMVRFATELWGAKDASIKFVKQVARWAVKADSGDTTARTSTWGVTYTKLNGGSGIFGADMVLEHVANNKAAVIKENVGTSENPVWKTNEPATEAIRAKAQEMAAKFKEWIWQDQDRRDRLAAIYNETYNTDRRRVYDGSHLTLPGSSSLIKLRRHQLNAVWRAIQDRVILLDHVVGAGKTYEMAAIAMELRRLGISRKPMFVVPNSLVRQWRDEFYKLYPDANVLAATESDFEKKNRKRFMAKIATGDWDAVIVAHSSFKKVGMPFDTEQAILDEQLKEIGDAIEDMKRERGDKNVVRDMERIKLKLEERMKSLKDSGGKKDDTVSFDELGVDGLFVDEAHLFKNLFYYSQMRNVTGLGNPNGSGRAFDLFVKTRFLDQNYGGKALIGFATGTPVSNSLVEMFTMQRYLAWNKLKENGLHLLDAWAGVYGDVQQVYEVHPSGTGYRLSTRFAKFVNLPSLMELYRGFSDVITMDDLKRQAKEAGGVFPIPKIKGAKPRNIVAERSEEQQRFFGVPEFGRDDKGGIAFKYPAELFARQSDKDGKWYPWLKDGSKAVDTGFDTKEEAEAEVATLIKLPVVGWNSGSILWKFENLKQLTKDSKGKINALSITNEARKAGLDYRLIDPMAPDFSGSKINIAVKEAVRIYHAWAADKGAQLMFCDLSVPKSARAAAASKERTAYVRNSDGDVMEVKATVVTIEGVEASFLAVKQTRGGVTGFNIYDGMSGAETPVASHTKAEAIAALKALIERDGLTWLEDMQDRFGEITEADIADYKDASGKEEAEDEEGDEGAISVAELMALAGGNRFSVYDDIKTKLIDAGIPVSEIAFIHDYDTATKKNDLFKKVRAGEIRILLGSTEKMGAGMNVQERLVALHHLDAPWRPSDLEQREGRLIRQGNELYKRDPDGFEVEIMRYGTRQTYDTRMWQIIEHKAAGVEQLRKAGDDLLEIDDVGGEAANAADMKAAASGNPLILDEIKMRNEVKSLEAQQFAYIQAKANMQDKVRWYSGAPRRAEERIAEIQPFVDAADQHPVEPFAYTTPEGKTLTDKKDVALPLTTAFADAAQSKLGETVDAGKYRGLLIRFRKAMGGITAYLGTGAKPLPAADYGIEDKFSPPGLFTRLDNALERVKKNIEAERASAKASMGEIPKLEAEIAKPFAKEDALKDARAKHRAIVSKLQKSGGGIELSATMREELDSAIVARGGKKGVESRSNLTREAFAANALQELATEDELFRYPVSQSGTLKGIFHDVFPGVEWFGETTRADEQSDTGAEQRYTMKTPDTPATDGKPEVIGKQFEVYVTRDRVWIDVHRSMPGDQGSRIYAAVANFAYNTRRVFGGDPAGVSADAIMARNKMMLASALRFGTTRHLDASNEQIKGISDAGIARLDWRGNDIDKIRSLIHTFAETANARAPDLQEFHYDFARQGFFDRDENPVSKVRLLDATRAGKPGASGFGADSGRAAILIQSLVREEGRGIGDGGILQAILDYSRALVKDGGLKGLFSKATPAQAGVSASGGTESARIVQSIVNKFKAQFKGAEALTIRVVRTAQDIPARFRPSPFAEGVFHDDAGLIYLVTMNLKHLSGQVNSARVWQVLMHEAVGHFGLAQMMGARFAGILKQVQQAARARGEVTEDTYQPGDADYATMEAVRLRYPEASDEEVAQEVLARMAETDPGRTLFGYVRAVVRQWLRDMARAAGFDLDVTTAELNDLVARASAYMRRGDFIPRGVDVDALGVADMGVGSAASMKGMEARRAPSASQPKNSRRGLLDTALRKLGGEAAAKITGPAYDKLTTYLGGNIPEGIKAGVVSDFGLDEAYVDRRTELQTEQQKAARKTKSFVEALMTLDRAQSRVAYQWLNNRGAEADRLMAQLPEESKQALTDIKHWIAQLTVEAVRLGQLDAETASRNFLAYLHRSYAKYDLNTDDKTWKAERAKAIKIFGDQYKGRGLKMDVDPDRIHSAPGWWQDEMKGKRVKVLKNDAGRFAFVAEGTAIPPNYAGYKLEGVWEIRARKAGNRITLWRDFSEAERQMMGELDEAKYAVARTLFMMTRDIEVGRFHEWVADEYAKLPEDADADGVQMAEPSESMMRAFRTDEWVTVPTAKIPGTGVFKFGALAGMVVPGPVWNDIRQISAGNGGPFVETWKTILRAWKLSKTALTPTTHVNNIMGNFVMADMHDVGARDVIGAVRLMLAASNGDKDAQAMLDRFEDSGATQGMFTTHELKREVLEPLLKALREEVGMADDEGAILKASAILSLALHGQIGEAVAGAKAAVKQSAVGRGVGAAVTKAQDYYQAEDALFRFAAFLKGIEDGKTDRESGKAARKAFLDYHINAPWINAMRGTAMPFIAFAYRAIPMLIETAAKKPWKVAKYMLVAGGLNALAYAMLGADGDEDKERAYLPDEKAGRLWGIVPKLIRMPWNRESTLRDGRKTSDPVFLDVRRWIPVGDVVDYGQDKTALPLIPQPLMPGGPLIIAGEFLVNKSAFTGRDLTKETDTWVEKAAKVGGHFYKGFAPNLPIPQSGTWAGTKIDNAIKGKEDPLGRAYPVPEAIASGFGLKLERYPVDTLQRNAVLDMKGKLKELSDEQRQAARDYGRQGMSKVELDEKVTEIVGKKNKAVEEYKAKERRAMGRTAP